MRFDPANPTDEIIDFLTERHLATLSIPRPGVAPHLTPVGVTFDAESATARVITWAASTKARLVSAEPGIPVAVCQVDGGRWLTLSGPATITDEAAQVEMAEAMYTARYRPPKARSDRVVIVVSVESMLGRV